MRCFHGAVVAVIVWCLIRPAIYDPINNPHLQPTDPLSRWQIQRKFDSRDACEKFKSDYDDTMLKMLRVVQEHPEDLKKLSEDPQHHFDPRYLKAATRSLELERCINSDDSRLKGK